VKKYCVYLVLVALIVSAMPAMAARVAVKPITHPTDTVYQAYPGSSDQLPFTGYASNSGAAPVITAVPGVLAIDPGTPVWANFVGAANANSPGGLWAGTWTIKNVILNKETPSVIQCDDVFVPKVIQQQGTPNIRLWWPLAYEVPGTCWTLTILYGTGSVMVNGVAHHYDDDGAGSNPESPVHQEEWKWCVGILFAQDDEPFNSIQLALDLFHELPFGLDEVPLVSDEDLYPVLSDLIAAAATYADAADLFNASIALSEFELEVRDACIGVSPRYPWPTGPGTGIAQTLENPACCKLLVDAEAVGFKYNIFQQSK